MTDLNDPNLAPVSFIKGGLQFGSQVHLEGTFAYVPRAIAELDEDEQVREFGDVYFTPGIRRGFPAASETYLAAQYRQRLNRDIESSAMARGLRPAASGEGEAPAVTEQAPSAIGAAISKFAETESPPPPAPPETGTDTEPVGEEPEEDRYGAEPTAVEPPWPDAEDLNIEKTRERLATASDEEIDRFRLWEENRERPRVTLLRELEG